MNTRKIEIVIPEPGIGGYCNRDCPLCVFRGAMGYACQEKLSEWGKPGPGCPWYKP